MLFFIGYSVRTAQITPRKVIKTYTFAYGILFISTYALRGPKDTYILFQFEYETDSLFVHKLLFFIGYSVRTPQITPINVIKTYTFAYGILFISTYALRGPRTLISYFNLKMRQIVFTSINCYFLLDIPLEQLKLHLEK